MKDDWAARNLQVIRTLMERSAIYRRALAPLMTVTGCIGSVAALAGWKVGIQGAQAFVGYWLSVAVVTVVAGLLLIRRQALQQGEVFWSPPTRQVSQAMLLPLLAGLLVGLTFLVAPAGGTGSTLSSQVPSRDYLALVCLPVAWVVLYGCAIHAAGFFMQRGVRVFGRVLVILACLTLLVGDPTAAQGKVDLGYLIMGGAFGLLHLLYGIYLFATEKRTAVE